MINSYQNKCAGLIRATLGLQRKKQTELSKKLGINRVVLNLFLNRKLDLIPEDIQKILDELSLHEKIAEENNDDPV